MTMMPPLQMDIVDIFHPSSASEPCSAAEGKGIQWGVDRSDKNYFTVLIVNYTKLRRATLSANASSPL
jgi:hypothetical protein